MLSHQTYADQHRAQSPGNAQLLSTYKYDHDDEGCQIRSPSHPHADKAIVLPRHHIAKETWRKKNKQTHKLSVINPQTKNKLPVPSKGIGFKANLWQHLLTAALIVMQCNKAVGNHVCRHLSSPACSILSLTITSLHNTENCSLH